MNKSIPQSILYTPALDSARLAKARHCDADVWLIDLEDSVPRGRKAAARELCTTFLSQNKGDPRSAVRINEMRSLEYSRDIVAFAETGISPGIIVMTMVETAEEVSILRAALRSFGLESEVYVTVETARAVTLLDEIAAVSSGMILGSADLASSLGVDISWENMLFARQRMALAGARFRIPCIDTACFNLADDAELDGESVRCRSLGFHGKVAVHPAQLPTINRIFKITPHEIAHAKRVVEASRCSNDEIATLDGKMIGPPFVKRAIRLLEIAGK